MDNDYTNRDLFHLFDDETVGRSEHSASSLPVLWDGWETVRLIGSGSFGSVYEIRRCISGIEERAALKHISIPKDAGEIASLRSNGMDELSITNWFDECMQNMAREYSLMKELKGYTNIVCCDDFRTVRHSNAPGWDIYIKMELLTALPDKLDRQSLPEEELIRLAKDICQALVVCKSRNVLHRDIKPQNIFVSRSGEYKLGDFGISTISDHTTRAATAGTYRYMAPEVFHNKPYGTKADIYSLGLVLYWLLNERRSPFEPLPPEQVTMADTELARSRRFSGERLPEPLHGSAELKRIVLKACEYSPENRYHSAQEMLDALNRIGEKKISQKLIVGFGAAILALLIILSVVLLWPDSPPKPEDIPESEMQTEAPVSPSPTPLVYDPASMYRFTLSANEEMTVKEFNAAAQLVKNRLDTLAGDIDYGFQLLEDSIELIIPDEMLGGVDPVLAMKWYISRPIDLYLADLETEHPTMGKPKSVSLSRSDIESVSLKAGPIEGVDASQFGIDTQNYSYIELVLTEDFAQKAAAEFEDWSRLILAQDISFDDWCYIHTIPQADGRSFLLLNSDLGSNYIETVYYNYSHDSFEHAFSVDVEKRINWERTDEAFVPGALQCNESELTGESVLVFYNTSITDRKSGDWINTLSAIKARLDVLERPYAIGVYESEGQHKLVVKTSPDRMGLPIMKMLVGSRLEISCGLKKIYVSSFSISEQTAASSGIEYHISLESYSEEDSLSALTADLGKDETAEILLSVSDLPVLSTTLTGSPEDNSICFNTLYFNSHETLGDEHIWLLNLLDRVLFGSTPYSLYFEGYEFVADENGNLPDESSFGANYNEVQKSASDAVKAALPGVKCYASNQDPLNLIVLLDLYVDESLPELAAQAAKTIYEASDFENSGLNTIYIYLVDEDDTNYERARIFFRKYYYDQRIGCHGIFANGRLDKYKDHFIDIVESDKFFAEKTDEYSFWN